MDYAIVWAESSVTDLRELVRYISGDNPGAAERFGLAVIKKVDVLQNFLRLGRMVPEFRDDTIRELVLSPYRIVYEVKDPAATVAILRIWHAKRGDVELEQPSSREVPERHRTLVEMMNQAFPAGLDPEDYFPLLCLMRQTGCSFRAIAANMEICFGLDYHRVLNDAYATDDPAVTRDTVAELRQRLLPHGLAKWETER